MRDIRLSKEMGFNGASKHHKIEAPRYPYHADRMGFLVWTEVVLRDYNHPCIVAWVPLNESCGVDVVMSNREEQAHSQVMYYLTESRLGALSTPSSAMWSRRPTGFSHTGGGPRFRWRSFGGSMKEGANQRAEVITMGETMVCFSPDTPAPLRYVDHYHRRIAGAESNLAIGLSKLGHRAAWVSRLGDDEFGRYVQNAVRAEGVDTGAVRFDGENPTGLMFKETSRGETRVYYYRKGSAASAMRPEDLDESLFREAKLLHLTGITPVLSDSCRDTVFYAVELAEKYGLKISFDPNIRRKLWGDRDYSPLIRELCGRCHILMIGREEAEALYREAEPEALFWWVFSEGNRVEAVVVKDGANGAWAADCAGAVFLEPVPCRCVDPIGAGDAFNAAFLAGVLEGRTLEDCGRMGAVAGAMATETDGDTEGYPDRRKLESMLNNREEFYR